MNGVAKKYTGKLLNIVPLGLYQILTTRKIFSFFYHVVSNNPLPHTTNLYPHRPTELFEKDLEYLSNHYDLLSYDQIEDGKHKKASKPCAFISFDDGFSECYSIVRPILLRLGVPCTFFLATDFIDNRVMYYRNKVSLIIDRFQHSPHDEINAWKEEIEQSITSNFIDQAALIRWLKSKTDEELIDRICELVGADFQSYLFEHKPYLTVDQIRSLSSDGFTFGAHSKSHHKLGGLTQSLVETEILESCLSVRNMTGQLKIPFSFPNSGEGVNRDHIKMLRESNSYLGLFFDSKGLREDGDFIFNRVWVEAPKFNPGGSAPIFNVLRSAYQENAMWTVSQRRKKELEISSSVILSNQDPIESTSMID